MTIYVSRSRLKKKALWLASGDLDLRRFYRFGTWSVEYFLLRGLGRFDPQPPTISACAELSDYLTRWHRPVRGSLNRRYHLSRRFVALPRSISR